ncbi:MAG: GAF domain-containing protein [bacterium]|nr:GAF domain-containing protein [bacterium]
MQYKALANKLLGKLYLFLDEKRIAGLYLTDAYYDYQVWGATEVLAFLTEQYAPYLDLGALQRQSGSHQTQTISGTSGTQTDIKETGAIDLDTVTKAARAISGEVVLDELLTKLMQTVREDAGAEKALLLLAQGPNNELLIQAQSLAEHTIDVMIAEKPEESDQLSLGIVNYVAHSLESVVLGDATEEGDFTADPYIQTQQPKSVLGMPILNQGKLVGLLYLENNITAHAFTPDRLEVLQILASQAAISIENSLVFDHLEERVAERTHQLEVVATLSGQLNAILDFDQLLTELVNQIGANFHYYHTQIYLLDKAGENLIVTKGMGPAGTQMSRQGHHIPLNAPTSLVARAARSGQVVRMDNVRKTEDWLPNPLLPGTYAEMAVPIVGEGQVVGVLDVQDDKIGGLDEGDANLLRSLAGQVAVALTNARLFEQTRQAQQDAEIANRAKSDFLSSMSHELRTPLNGILGYSQILKRSRTMDETDRKGVAIIQNSGEHLLTLIDDLLDLSKIEAGKMELFPDTLYLPSFLDNVTGIIHSRAAEKGLNFLLERHQNLPSGIEADETRLRQVLLNLLGNAIKFTESGQVTLTVSLLGIDPGHADDRRQISLRFEVQDTGIGMQPEELHTIFRPYEQVGEGKHRRKGTGLGLAITRRLVTLMGGDVHADSRPGQGSRFWFEASFPEVEGLRVETEVDRAPIVGYEGERRKVLIVDDRPENRRVLQSLLEPLGFVLQTAENGHEAVQHTQRFEPDLILMDLMMPIMNGFDAIKAIRAAPDIAQPRIVVVSAEAFQAERQQARAAGCDDYLVKPFRDRDMFDLMTTHLGVRFVYENDTSSDTANAKIEDIPEGEDAAPLVPPPMEDLAALYELALSGRVLGLQEHALRLAEMDAVYRPFSDTLQALLRGFELDTLTALVEQHMEAAQDERE